jgi:hypothetical protein
VLFGFPFETVEGRETRRELMARTLVWIGVVEDPDPDEGGCGCRLGGARIPLGTGALFVVLFWLCVRRRR